MTSDSDSPRQRFFLSPELFIYPLALVSVLVFVYLFFGAIGKEKRTVGQLIGALRGGGALDWQGPRRAAEELAKRIQELEAQGRKLEAQETSQLVEILMKGTGDPTIHRYLVHALGRAGQEELAFPVLVSILSDRERPLEARVEAIRGLGLSRSSAAAPPLLDALEEFRRPEDWEVRASILQMLTNIGAAAHSPDKGRSLPPLSPPEGGVRTCVAATLRQHLADPHPMVARNAAMWLAENFEDPAGVEVLRPLLDWEFLGRQGFNQEGQEWWMRRAIQSLAAVRDEESLPAIQKHASENRSYKVKDAALRALRDRFQVSRS